MKKIIVILLGILFIGFQSTNAQKLYPPVQPYNESGYTLRDFRAFALKNSPLSESYRTQLVKIVNLFLQETGEYKNYNDGNPVDVNWIFDPVRTWSEHRTYRDGFYNSHQSEDGKSMISYWDTNVFDGMVMVLHVHGYQKDLSKTICMNLLYNISYIYVAPITYSPPVRKVEKKIDNSEQDYHETFSNKPLTVVQPKPDLGLDKIVTKKKNKGLKGWIIGVGGGIVLGAIYAFFHKEHSSAGTPGPAPITPPVPGVPGGAVPTPPGG